MRDFNIVSILKIFDNLVTIGEKDNLKFKIILKKELQSTEPNLASCRIKLDACENDKFEVLKSLVIDKFTTFGIVKDNFDIFWHDDQGDNNIIKNDDDLLEALEELKGPLYELIACFQSKVDEGKIKTFFQHF